MRTHYEPSLGAGSICGRGRRVTDNVFSVDCGLCQDREVYRDALEAAKVARENAFQLQTPRTIVPQFGRVNADGVMECSNLVFNEDRGVPNVCGGILWRERPRSLFSYHYVCAKCGKSVHPMTETGMCT